MVHCTRIYQANVNDCCQNTTIRCLVGYSTVHHPSGWIMDSWCAEPLRLRSEVPILNVECCLVGTFQASSGEKIRHSAERSRLPSDTASKKCSMLLRARRIFFFSLSPLRSGKKRGTTKGATFVCCFFLSLNSSNLHQKM